MDTGEKPENEKRPSTQYRIILILIATTVVLAITLGTTLLAREVELRWAPLPVLHLVAAAIMTVVSGACINLLPTVATDIWRMKQPDRPRLSTLLRKGRGWRVAGVVGTVVVLVLASVWWRPWRVEPGDLVVMTAFPADPKDARTVLLEQWNRLNPNNRASFDYVAGSHDAQHIRMVRDARSGGELATRAFADGRTVYMRNWPVERDNIGDSVPFLSVAPPTNSVLGGQNLAISASTDKPRAAQELIKFLTNASSQQILSEVGSFVPTRTSAFTYAKRPDAPAIQAALNVARVRPVTPCYVEFSQLFRDGIDRALSDGGKLREEFPRELAEVLLNC
jgi:hypothetical protein